MEVTRLGNIYGFDGGNYAGNVYDKHALAPTMLNMQGGNRQPMIIENVIVGGMQENQSIKKDGVCTCLTSSMGMGGGYVPMVVDRNEDLSVETVKIKQATETGVCRIEGYKNFRIRKMTEEEYQKAMDAYYRTKIRIRKLTPKECWRLMDFSDEDFRKAESVNSNTQLYKQAGNSIVRNCLVAIFGQMMPGKEDDYKKGA